MVWGVEVDPTDIPGILAAIGFLGFGIWVFFLDPGSRLHRAFSLLMVLRAGFILFVRLGENVTSVMGRVAGYFEIVIPVAALYFGLAYRDRIRGKKTVSRFNATNMLPILLGAAVVLEVAYWRDHELLNSGPFLALFGLSYLAFGIFAWVLARAATATRQGPITRHFAILGSFGLAIEAAYQATWQFSESVTEIVAGEPGRAQYLLWYIQVSQLGHLFAALLSIGAAFLILTRGTTWTLRQRWNFAAPIFFAAALAIPFAVMFALQLVSRDGAGIERWIAIHRVAGGLAMLAGLLVIAYAVLRQRLLNIQWKLRVAVRGTTLGGIFLAVLFALSEGLQVVFQRQAEQSGISEGVGSAIGIVGAGIVVFALHPVQRFAERLATRTVPNGKPIDSMSDPERIALYREQAELAWLDGELRRKERLLLDGLRHRLGMSLAEAAQIESEAMRRTTGIGFQNRSIGEPPRETKRPRRGRSSKH